MNEFFTESLSGWLLRTTIEGTILIGVVLLISAILGRNLGPRWRVALWTLVGVKLLVPASMTFLPGLGNWADFAKNEAVLNSPANETPSAETPIFEADPFLAESIGTSEPIQNTNVGFSLTTWLVIVWFSGVVVFFATLIFKQRRFVAKSGGRYCCDRDLLGLVAEVAQELKLKQSVPVILGRAGSTPAVFGAFQPRLLLPEDWADRFDEEGLRYILMHELEHVRYGDVKWNWAAALVNALHWFNPLVWLATARFQADRELRCDADTLARLKSNDRVAYGRTLLTVQETFHAAPAIAGLAPCVRNHPALRQRIAMITKPTASRSWLNVVFTLALTGLICLSFGSAVNADDERERREGAREGERGSSREGAKDGDRREGGEREGTRDGDRREGGAREGARDGDRREGGEREGARDGDRREGGAREGDRAQMRDGQLKVTVVKDGVVIGDRKIALINLRGELEKQKAKSAVIFANKDVPFQNVKTVVNALGNSGINKVSFATDDAPALRDGDQPREGARDGERGAAREGARDGDMRREGEGGASREGARDGDRPREGARDGDMRREGGARDGEGGAPREGARDGERGASREGARDGDMRREGGARDGEGGASREGARDGERGAFREGARDGEGGSKESARDGGNSAEGRGSASAEMDDKKLAQLSRIFKTYDKDNSKTVTFKEWVAMKNYELTRDQEKREKGWFDEADSNENGELTVGEWIDWKSSQGR